MKTIDRRLDENEINKLVKIVGDDNIGGDYRTLDESEIDEILRLIEDCCYVITNEENSDSILKNLADTLRKLYESDYCSIGKVDGEFVEDCVVSWRKGNKIQDRDLKSVKRVRLNNPNCCVCKGLKSNKSITYYNGYEIKGTENYNVYEILLGEVRNTTIIPIRDRNNANKGFIQLINSKKRMGYYYIKPFYDSLLRLVLILLWRDELKDEKLFKKDADFLSKVQKNIDDVDLLLNEIMEYFSKEFSAGVISYRIPLLVGTEKDKRPLFYLRACYIKEEISKDYTRDDYFRDRLVKCDNQMGGYEKLACKEIESVIIDKAKDSDYYKRHSNKEIVFRDDTLIIPVLRDYYEKDECLHPQKNKDCSCDIEAFCPFRFAKYFGVFKLRILRSPNTSLTDYEGVDEWLSEETKKRLANLAKHISILLNAIVDKYENKSLNTFQKELKGTSFTKIRQFDEQYSKIVKKAIHTSNCAIYRYKDDKLMLSASSDPINDDFSEIIERYDEHGNNLVKTLFAEKKPVYFVRNDKEKFNSIMVVPMIRKDNSKLGVMLLIGKDDNLKRSNISKTFWEHDKKHIEFIVDVLTRIEESDSERLTFLSQLSHELLRPVAEMVYRNDYHISIAMRNPEAYSKKNLIKEMQKNVDMCMMFKEIVDDVEYIYSLSKGDVDYNFEMADFKGIIIDAIRFFEEDAAASKKLTIKTYLKNIPARLYVDKSRMMQVVINLLKNAIQYSLPNEEISISYEFNEKNDYHEISFSDKGIPVNPKEKDAIFELFVRSKQAVLKRPSGSGIGLYLVKQIMKAHGGDCYVKELSFPTIFTIQIPNKK